MFETGEGGRAYELDATKCQRASPLTLFNGSRRPLAARHSIIFMVVFPEAGSRYFEVIVSNKFQIHHATL